MDLALPTSAPSPRPSTLIPMKGAGDLVEGHCVAASNIKQRHRETEIASQAPIVRLTPIAARSLTPHRVTGGRRTGTVGLQRSSLLYRSTLGLYTVYTNRVWRRAHRPPKYTGVKSLRISRSPPLSPSSVGHWRQDVCQTNSSCCPKNDRTAASVATVREVLCMLSCKVVSFPGHVCGSSPDQPGTH